MSDPIADAFIVQAIECGMPPPVDVPPPMILPDDVIYRVIVGSVADGEVWAEKMQLERVPDRAEWVGYDPDGVLYVGVPVTWIVEAQP